MSEPFTATLSRLPGRQQTLASREVLFRAGDPVRYVFFVEEGAVHLVRNLPQGSELTLQRAGPGALLAEASIFAQAYHCDAVANVRSIVHAIPRRRFEDALSEDPRLSISWARHLAIELQKTRALGELLALKTVRERIDGWLALNRNEMPPKGNWRSWASEIGVSPEALYRELAMRRSRLGRAVVSASRR